MLRPWAIYRHGFSLRLQVRPAARARTMQTLARTLWWGDGRRWRGKGERKCLRGSAWLTGYRPSCRTVLGRLNRREKLCVYNLAVVVRKDGLYVDVEGVRRGDVDELMARFLGLARHDYETKYLRRLEVYVALAQPEAERLARELGGVTRREGGRRARVVWILEGLAREVTIRTRARAVAYGKLYRVQPERGATAAYRLEVWLEGERRGRGEFFEDDQVVLEEWLHELVREHDLHPIERPACWAGESEEAPRFFPRDADLATMTMKAYRGRRPAPRNCHPPATGESAPQLVLHGPEARVRGHARVSCPVPRGRHGEDVLAREIASDPVSLLSEVILDADHDPGPLIGHLVRELGGQGQVAVGYIGLPDDTWYWVRAFTEVYPATGDEMTLVLVIEPELLGLLIEGSWILPDGSVDPLALGEAARGWKAEVTSCGILGDVLQELRRHCETTGLRFVLITLDDRPGEGRMPWVNANRFNDGAVRSAIGDDGRFYAHARYRIERDATVALKCERHGRPGRFLWRREVGGPRIEL